MGAMGTIAGTVKVIGSNGQISLGKQFAGRRVLVEEQEPGVWLIRTAAIIPDNERWLHTPEAKVGLARGFAWALANPVRTDNADQLLEEWYAKD